MSDDREQKQRRGDAEPDSEGPVRRRNGIRALHERDRDDTVASRASAVEHDEDAGEDREEAVHLLDGEPRPGQVSPRADISTPTTTEAESSR